MKKLLYYVKPNNSSFIRNDEELLSKHFKVLSIDLEQSKGNVYYLKNMIRMCYQMLRLGLQNKFIAVCWFADYHAAIMLIIARMTGNKSIILAGGQEAVCYYELQKGVYRNKFRSMFVKFALRHVSLLIANHKSLLYHENFYYNTQNPHIDGIQHYVKGFNRPVEIIYNGIDPEKFKQNTAYRKVENRILTVGTMHHLGDFQNKGFDLFIETAARNPQWDFVLIGMNKNYLSWLENTYKVSKIANLTIIAGFCEHEVLNRNYNEAKVFVQASITEGMPNTLSEAMLLGCIPVGSNINGIPDAIGNTGQIITHRTLENYENAITNALLMDTSIAARTRVQTLFSVANREKKLKKTVEEL